MGVCAARARPQVRRREAPSVLVWAALRRTDELCPIQKAGGGWAQAQERMPSNSVYMSVFVLIIVTGYYSVHPKH